MEEGSTRSIPKSKVLAEIHTSHYDDRKKLVVSCGASPSGVGAVLAHIMPDGTERTVGYASRTLNNGEHRYSQVDKEGLAVIFGVKKFHIQLHGRAFQINADHKPLLRLFHEKRAIPTMAYLKFSVGH